MAVVQAPVHVGTCKLEPSYLCPRKEMGPGGTHSNLSVVLNSIAGSTSFITCLISKDLFSLASVYSFVRLLQEGEPLPGPESGLLSNTRKGTVRGDTRADKARDFMGKGRPGGEQEGEGPQEDGSATWLAVSGFMVMG